MSKLQNKAGYLSPKHKLSKQKVHQLTFSETLTLFFGENNQNLVYRKTLDGPWICSWNWGFEHNDIQKVVDHENNGEY